MQRYRNLSGKSGIAAYAIASDALIVRFVNGSVYRYTRASAGARHLSTMIELAQSGRGLATYISQHHDVDYER